MRNFYQFPFVNAHESKLSITDLQRLKSCTVVPYINNMFSQFTLCLSTVRFLKEGRFEESVRSQEAVLTTLIANSLEVGKGVIVFYSDVQIYLVSSGDSIMQQ